MLTENRRDRVAHRVNDEVEVEAPAKTVDAGNHDQYVHYSHELPDETSEAASRGLIRFVPIAYGALLGALADNLAVGLSIGALLSAALDLAMGEDSIVRPFSRRLFTLACPLLAAAAQALGHALGRLGIAAPAVLNRVQCAGPRL